MENIKVGQVYLYKKPGSLGHYEVKVIGIAETRVNCEFIISNTGEPITRFEAKWLSPRSLRAKYV